MDLIRHLTAHPLQIGWLCPPRIVWMAMNMQNGPKRTGMGQNSGQLLTSCPGKLS